MRIIAHELIDDDSVVERAFKVHKIIDGLPGGAIDLDVDWGIPLNRKPSGNGEEGAYAFSAALERPEDLDKLRAPRLKYRETETLRELDAVQALLGDILDVKLVGVDRVSFHIMYFYTGFRGLETMFYDLYDEPELAHRIVRFFADGYRSIVDQCLEQNLFSLNSDGTYQGTGGFGYTRELPAPGFDGVFLRAQDLWASAEAQDDGAGFARADRGIRNPLRTRAAQPVRPQRVWLLRRAARQAGVREADSKHPPDLDLAVRGHRALRGAAQGRLHLLLEAQPGVRVRAAL